MTNPESEMFFSKYNLPYKEDYYFPPTFAADYYKVSSHINGYPRSRDW
jgi:hypothetical protein